MNTYKKGDAVLNIGFKQLNGQRKKVNGENVVSFKVPPTEFQDITIDVKK